MTVIRKFLYPWTGSPRRRFWRAWTVIWLIVAVLMLLNWWPS